MNYYKVSITYEEFVTGVKLETAQCLVGADTKRKAIRIALAKLGDDDIRNIEVEETEYDYVVKKEEVM